MLVFKADRINKLVPILIFAYNNGKSDKDVSGMSELPCGKYRHYKGKDYEVIGFAKHSETLEEFVVYRALYGNFELWLRPKEMFFATVTIDGKPVRRFEPLD